VFWFAGPWDDDQVSAEGTDTCDLLYLGESLRWTDGAQGGVQAPVERGVGNSVQALDLDCGKPIDRRHRPERVGSGNAPFGIRVKWSDDTIVFSRKSAASDELREPARVSSKSARLRKTQIGVSHPLQ